MITICNGTNMIVYVELHPIELVRRNKSRNKNFGFGVEAKPLEGAGGVNVQVHWTLLLLVFASCVSFFFEHDFCLVYVIQVELGEVDHEKELLDSRKETVHPHSICNIELPKEHISKVHTENAVLLHNCLFSRLTGF